jgi:hypothetical protein
MQIDTTTPDQQQHTAGSQQPFSTPQTYEQQLVFLFAKHNPDKIASVQSLLEKFAGQEDALISMVMKKYVIQPANDAQTAEQLASSNCCDALTYKPDTPSSGYLRVAGKYGEPVVLQVVKCVHDAIGGLQFGDKLAVTTMLSFSNLQSVIAPAVNDDVPTPISYTQLYNEHRPIVTAIKDVLKLTDFRNKLWCYATANSTLERPSEEAQKSIKEQVKKKNIKQDEASRRDWGMGSNERNDVLTKKKHGMGCHDRAEVLCW